MGEPFWGQAIERIEDHQVEIGPRLDGVVLPEWVILASLRRYRAEKPRKVPFAALAQYAGLRPTAIEKAIQRNKVSPQLQRALSWLIIALDRGEVRFVRWRGPNYLVRADAPLSSRPLRRAAERCICGRYNVCPCGCIASKKVQWQSR